MKKLLAILLAVALVAGGLAIPVSANALFTTDLIADGGSLATATDIGDVQVWEDSGNLYVKYVVTEPNWVITHVHFHVADSSGDIPQNRSGNPKIGHFDYSIPFSPGVTEYTSDPISLSGLTSPVYIAAQAEVYYNEAVIYGMEYGGSYDIHAVNPISGNYTWVADPPVSPTNAAAFDSTNNRLYYQEYSTKDLYFYDLVGDNHTLAGNLIASTHAASFYGGKYYYIAEFTDDLYEVSFDAAGYVVSDTKLADISGDTRAFDFGDIAVTSDGTIYGAPTAAGPTDVFFKVGTDGLGYIEIATGDLGDWPLQLAFGSDGTLYGNYHATGKFYVIDMATGDTTEISTGSGYADLASGSAPARFETAWGDGAGFSGRNWAMYIEYEYELGG